LAITGRRSTPDNEVVRKALADTFEAAARVLANARHYAGDVHDPDRPQLLTLVSALAQGADQLAVEAFLAAPMPDGMQRQLEAILPFAEYDYAGTMVVDDMGTPDERAISRMRGLLADADRKFILADRARAATQTALGSDSPSEMEYRRALEERFEKNRYALIGDILVRQADLLIAVWDGRPNADIGGTPSVINQALRDGVPVLVIDIATGKSRILNAVVPVGDPVAAIWPAETTEQAQPMITALEQALRPVFNPPGGSGERGGALSVPPQMRGFFGLAGEESEPAISLVPSPAYRLYSALLWVTGANASQAPTNARQVRRWLEEHGGNNGHEPDNAAKPERESTAGANVDRSPPWRARASLALRDFPSRPLQCDHVRRNLEENGKPGAGPGLPLSMAIGRGWGFADAVATRLSHQYRSLYVGIFAIGALAVLFAVIGLMAKELKVYCVLAELLLLSTGFILYRRANARDVHGRFLVARRIAEELRPAWAMARLGLGGRRILGEDARWNSWVTQGWIASVGLPDLALGRSELVATARDIKHDIVVDQLGYHKRNAIRLGLLHERLEIWGYLVVVGGISMTFAYLVLVGFAHVHHSGLDWAVAFAGAFLPALAAALAGIRFQGDFRRFAERSAQSAVELERIGASLDAFIDRMVDTKNAREDGFASLRVLLLDLERVLLKDLDDWHFVYRARPTPEVG